MSSGVVQLRAVDNDLDEADVEKGATDGFSVTGTVSVAAVRAPPAVQFAVRDDDLPQVSIAAPQAAADSGHVFEAEAADIASEPWVLTREGLLDAALAVTVTVSESGGDFVAAATEAASQTVTFPANDDTVSYTPVSADTVDESHGSVTVTLQNATGYDVAADAGAATANVRDDDGTGSSALLTLGAEPATLSVAEGSGASVGVRARTVADGTFTAPGDLDRVFGGATSVTVNASTADVTGTDAATAGTDYTALPTGTTATVRFADFAAVGAGGSAGLALPGPAALPAVQTTADMTADNNETFEVLLELPSATDARMRLDPAKATVRIVEGPPDGMLRICGADGQCVNQAGASCQASDTLCVSGTMAAVLVEGRVEVAQGGRFGTVCDDYWTYDGAHVACRQLGHAAGQRAYVRSHFGGAARGVAIWFDDVECSGSEATLADCPRNVGGHNCSLRHTEDAGIRCLGAVTAVPTVQVSPSSLTVPAGGTARYWVWLTRQPDHEDFWLEPRPPSGGVLSVSPDTLWITRHHGWSRLEAIDVSVSRGARSGSSHTIVHETTQNAYADGSVPQVPDVTVTVASAAPPTGGGAPPLATRAAVSGRTVTVSFDAALDSAFAPATADYVVLAADMEWRVAGAYVRGAELVLELARALPPGTPARVAYPAAPSSPLADRAGRPAGPFELAVEAAPPVGRAPDRLAEAVGDAPFAAGPATPGIAALEPAPKLEGAAELAAAVAEAPEPAAATLWAPRRGVTDLSELARLPGLRRANLAGNAVGDLAPLAGLPALVRLDLRGNAVTDVWPLAGLAELEVLDLSGNRIADVSALGGLPRLRVLELAGNAVADISPLVHLRELRYLGLAGNRVSDTGALAQLVGLVRLDLGANELADAEPLGNLSELVWLRVPGNRLQRVDALGRLTALRWVWLTDNPLLPLDAALALPAETWVDTGVLR